MARAVIGLPKAISQVGPKTFRWWCWRCGRVGRIPAKTEQTAIRQLDRHMHDKHDKDLPAHARGPYCVERY